MGDTTKRLRALGFSVWDTGGGCRALGLARPDGAECLVTDIEDGAMLPAGDDTEVLVGFYSADASSDMHGDNAPETQDFLSVDDAIARVTEWLAKGTVGS